jgi:hypothetical protein
VSELFISDTPSGDPSRDRFKRFPFAKRIAETLARRSDPASLVVAIQGKWGEGKTTVLDYIYDVLSLDENIFGNIVPVRFNPWRFRDESDLLTGFFANVAHALKRSPKTNLQHIGEALSKFGKFVTPSIEHEGVKVELDAVSRAGDWLAETTPEGQKKYISDMLVKEKRRVVLFVDDIDRLDRREIQAVVKLIKLTADFDNVDYVLAFDRHIVAEAIAEQYGERGSRAGYEYLQKLVQVDLELPMADRAVLAEMSLEGVKEGLKNAGIELMGPQKEEFQRAFEDYVLPALDTPRLAKQYANAVAFSLHLLPGEINPVDVLLLEAVKCLYPKLFDGIRSCPEDYIGEMTARDVSLSDPGHYAKNRKLRIEGHLQGAGRAFSDLPRQLVFHLFPQLMGLFSEREYGNAQAAGFREQRVSSGFYLRRYLTGSIPRDDISDRKVDALLLCPAEDSLDATYCDLLSLGPQWVVIDKLRVQIPGLDFNVLDKLAHVVARRGELLNDSSNSFLIVTESAAGLIEDILRRIEGNARRTLAIDIVTEAEPLTFAERCLRRMRRQSDRLEKDQLFSDAEEKELLASLAQRIEGFAGQEALMDGSPSIYIHLLFVWQQAQGSESVRLHVRQCLRRTPQLAAGFIEECAWTVSSRGEIRKETYEAICEVAYPADLLEAFQQTGLLDDTNAERPGRYAREFAQIHRDIQNASAQKNHIADSLP